MMKTTTVKLLMAASVLLLLSGVIFGFIRQWIYAALVFAGALGCLAAAVAFRNHEDSDV